LSEKVVGDGEAAVSGGDVLRLLEAEAADRAKGANLPALVEGAVGLAAILDHGDVALGRHLQDGVEIGRLPEEMDDHDCLRAVGDVGADRFGVDAPGGGVDIGENRHGVLGDDRDHGAEIGDRGDDDLVTRIGIEGGDGKVEGAGAGGGCHGLVDAEPLAECHFEGLHPRFGSDGAVELAGAEDLLDGLDLFDAEGAARGVGDGGERCFANAGSAVAGEGRHGVRAPFGWRWSSSLAGMILRRLRTATTRWVRVRRAKMIPRKLGTLPDGFGLV
jgi:hypothetical protein